MYLIAGLGNPGKQYELTRHNIGYRVISALAEKYPATKMKEQKKGLTAITSIGGQKVMLCEPLTYMNNSGQCIAALMQYYDIPLKKLIVIYDDIDLPEGTVRVREKGGAGTHNGMRSIVSHLGSKDFARIRVGVGAAPDYMDLADYVLGKFPKSQEGLMKEAVDKAVEAAALFVSQGIAATMNKINTRSAVQNGAH